MYLVFTNLNKDVATPLWRSVRMTLPLPKWGLESHPGLPKIHSSIAKVKTPHLEVLFIPLERSWSVDVENGLAWSIQTLAAQVMYERRLGIKLVVWLLTIKSRESTRPWCVQVECNTPWKALKERYKFAVDLIPIGGLSKELWIAKVSGVQIRTVLGILLGSPGKKCHSDVGVVE
jgi:hypothetical protein